jgi:hypothetical protein
MSALSVASMSDYTVFEHAAALGTLLVMVSIPVLLVVLVVALLRSVFK